LKHLSTEEAAKLLGNCLNWNQQPYYLASLKEDGEDYVLKHIQPKVTPKGGS